MNTQDFVKTIKDFSMANRRDLEWRRQITPYRVVVSEIMLQQTQVARVAIKFPLFIETFPSFESLAEAPPAAVLAQWQGMGYNRRGLYLKKIAEKTVKEFGGALPNDPTILETFPGIGPATARSIVAFAFNTPGVFIETNIRRVFIHFFFEDREGIHDKEILPFVEETLDIQNPREWYYALMDYGSILAKTVANPNRRSKHYTKQSAFEGSARRIRGIILRTLLQEKQMPKNKLKVICGDDRFDAIVATLITEGFIREDDRMYFIV